MKSKVLAIRGLRLGILGLTAYFSLPIAAIAAGCTVSISGLSRLTIPSSWLSLGLIAVGLSLLGVGISMLSSMGIVIGLSTGAILQVSKQLSHFWKTTGPAHLTKTSVPMATSMSVAPPAAAVTTQPAIPLTLSVALPSEPEASIPASAAVPASPVMVAEALIVPEVIVHKTPPQLVPEPIIAVPTTPILSSSNSIPASSQLGYSYSLVTKQQLADEGNIFNQPVFQFHLNQ